MIRKMMIRCAFLCAAILAAASCLTNQDGPTNKYDGYVSVMFEPENAYLINDFLATYFNGGKDTVAVIEYFATSPATHCSTLGEDRSLVGGIALCTGSDTLATPDRAPSRFAVYDEFGNGDSYVYAVFHDTTSTLMPEHDILLYVPNEDSSCSMVALFVQNVQATVQAALYGNGLSGGPFTSEDYLTLTVTGFKNGAQTGQKTVKLIDGTRPLEEWTEVDVTSLGSIDAVDYTLASSRSDFPLYCCVDDEVFHYSIIY